MRFLAMFLMIAALMTGCTTGSNSPPSSTPPSSGSKAVTMPSRAPYVTGVITKIQDGRVLVEANPDKQEGNKCWFALTSTTVVATEKDGKAEAIEQGALKQGQLVKAWESGPILESYPCQTGGEAILVTQP